MSTPQHSKIINKVAREVLKPLGVKRKGQSRTWLDDNGWWITVIEFQPSSWSKGTYLNIGINWQWYPKEHYAFDVGFREQGFVEYENDQQFEEDARAFAELAKSKVLEIRESLSTPESMKRYIISAFKEIGPTIWGEFHQGLACAVARDKAQAISFLQSVVSNSHDTEWALELKDFSKNLINLIESGSDYHTYLDEVVSKSRELKKLETTDIKIAAIA
ncbi:DUF4304 domain-containing protein [Shewanella algae]|uniref:DUF4304 domain-containing protein n=1 Tax=Shewanella algae TaxID=38313 RepID=UPI0016427373|nr:DUF4304 domain-containing protein [Shewanella algae]